MIIGICGFIGSGKDTVANYLVEEHNYQRDSFAGALKDAVASVFGWDRQLLEGATSEAREWREQVDTWWAERLNMPELTPRWVLQYWGTEVCRQGFHDDIWIASLEHRLLQQDTDIVISDVRFPNEVEVIKKAGGKVWWVQRGSLPDWYPQGMLASNGYTDAVKQLEEQNVHISEWAWLQTVFDLVLNNNSTVNHLYSKINSRL
jgi:hypothetical protein|tara:strand:- start:81 stop:692 length:612 start_codon:yes stop_codon:yes gene_type:complete